MQSFFNFLSWQMVFSKYLNLRFIISLTYILMFLFFEQIDLFKFTFLFGAFLTFIFLNAKSLTNFNNIIWMIIPPIVGWMVYSKLQYSYELLGIFLAGYVWLLAGSLFIIFVFKTVHEESYRASFLFGISLLTLATIYRMLGEGWFASLTILTFVLGAYLLSKYKTAKPLKALSIYFAPIILFNLILGDSFGNSLVFPLIIFGILISLLYYFYFKSNLNKWLLFLLPLLCIFVWLMQENYAFKRYCSANTSTSEKASFKIVRLSGDTLALPETGKISVYLFTSSFCSSCIREYPYFVNLSEQYKDDSLVRFYVIYLSFSDQDSLLYSKESKVYNSFNWGFVKEGRELSKKMKMNGVPHLLICDTKSNSIYSGRVYIRPWIFFNNPRIIITRVKKNEVYTATQNKVSSKIDTYFIIED